MQQQFHCFECGTDFNVATIRRFEYFVIDERNRILTATNTLTTFPLDLALAGIYFNEIELPVLLFLPLPSNYFVRAQRKNLPCRSLKTESDLSTFNLHTNKMSALTESQTENSQTRRCTLQISDILFTRNKDPANQAEADVHVCHMFNQHSFSVDQAEADVHVCHMCCVRKMSVRQAEYQTECDVYASHITYDAYAPHITCPEGRFCMRRAL